MAFYTFADLTVKRWCCHHWIVRLMWNRMWVAGWPCDASCGDLQWTYLSFRTFRTCYSETARAWSGNYCRIVSIIHYWNKMVFTCDLIMHLKFDLIKKLQLCLRVPTLIQRLTLLSCAPAAILSSGGSQSGRISFLLLDAFSGRKERHKQVAWCDLTLLLTRWVEKDVVRH